MKPLVILLFAALALAACDPGPEPAEPETEPGETIREEVPDEHQQALVRSFKAEREEALRPVRAAAEGYGEAVQGLLAEPGRQRLETARSAWHELYRSWNRALVVGAVQATGDIARLARIDPLPIMPGYVDGLEQWPDSGIVHDATLALDRPSLLAQQDLTAKGEATTGFQVIHFLLFGEPGRKRPVSDLLPPGEAVEAAGQEDGARSLSTERRRTYLAVVTELLVDDLLWVAEKDESGEEPVRATTLLAALAHGAQRLALVEELRGADNPAGSRYLAPDSGETARPALREAIGHWITGEGADPLQTLLEERDPDLAQALRDESEHDPLRAGELATALQAHDPAPN